ncbi:MAG: hypothetical protein HYZ44_14505 [Bacteroidetes bacterium]|nr:hypothetical protein [Bacteroidota bacterium]
MKPFVGLVAYLNRSYGRAVVDEFFEHAPDEQNEVLLGWDRIEKNSAT